MPVAPICLPPLDSTNAAPKPVGFRGRGWFRLAGAACAYEKEGEPTKSVRQRIVGSFHFFASCLLEPFCVIRNAVRARASSSFMLRFGSIVPGRMVCGSLSQW
jgi:hypothetical protein